MTAYLYFPYHKKHTSHGWKNQQLHMIVTQQYEKTVAALLRRTGYSAPTWGYIM
jgi:hypothetical protein